MDALEKLGWEKKESKKEIEYKCSKLYETMAYEEETDFYIIINKKTKDVKMWNYEDEATVLSKEELLALAEVVKEME